MRFTVYMRNRYQASYGKVEMVKVPREDPENVTI